MWKHCAKSRKLLATLAPHWPGLRRPLSRNASVKPGSGLDCRVRYQYHFTPQTKSIFLNVGTFPRKTKRCKRLVKGEYAQRCIMARNLSPRYNFKLAITSTLYTLIRVDTPLNRHPQRFVSCRPPTPEQKRECGRRSPDGQRLLCDVDRSIHVGRIGTMHGLQWSTEWCSQG